MDTTNNLIPVENSDAQSNDNSVVDSDNAVSPEMLNKAKDLMWSSITPRNREIFISMANSNDWKNKNLILKHVDVSYTFF